MTYLLEVCISNAIVATCLAIVAGLAGKLCRRPALIHTLWLFVLLKLITPPIWRIPVVWQTVTNSAGNTTVEEYIDDLALTGSVNEELSRGDGASAEFVRVIPESGTPDMDAALSSPNVGQALFQDVISGASSSIRWDWIYSAQTIVWVWFVGSTCWFVAAVVRMMQFHKLLGHGKRASSGLQEEGASIARRLGLGRCPELWIVPGRVSPLLWAMGGRVRLVLPHELLESLAPDQQATLLAHELAHARRRDHWVRWVEFVVLGLYWWHPVAWLARRAIHRAEEQCCDAWVVWALPGRARAYAEALLETVGFLSGVRCAVPPVASGIGHVQLLRRRLTMILRETLSPRVSWRVRLMAILFGMCVLSIAPYHLTAAAEPGVSFDFGLTSQSDREMRDLERRLDALEKKLDRLVNALDESRESAKPEKPAKVAKPKSAVEADQPASPQPTKTTVKDLAKKEAAAAKAARLAQEARHAGQRARKEAEKVDPDELAAIGRQVAESIKEKFDPERMADLARQIGEAVNSGIDPAQMAEIGRQIGEAVNKGFDPKQMEELGRQIEQAINENFSPERMKEFERQIEEAVNKSLDPKQLEQLSKQIEQTVNENFSPDRMKELERQIEQAVNKAVDPRRMEEMERAIEQAVGKSLDSGRMKDLDEKIERSIKKNIEIEIDDDSTKARPKSDTKPEPRKPAKRLSSSRTDSTRSDDSNPDTREFERRMRTLEQKMDRLLDAFESKTSTLKP